MRLSATRSLFERRDVIIVSSVSCIYGLGSPEAYYGMMLPLERGQQIDRDQILRKLVEIQYERNDHEFARGAFRVRGDIVEVCPSYEDTAVRIELFGDEVDELVDVRSADRQDAEAARQGGDLSEDPLRHFSRPDQAGGRNDQGRADLVSRAARVGRQGARSAPAAPAHDVRSRDDQGDRLLPRDRELRAPSHRPRAGAAAADAARLPAGRRADDRRREPPDGAADPRHVSRRPLAQGGAGRLRVPPALGARQPAAQLRGVGNPCRPDDVRLGDARSLRTARTRAAPSSSRSSVPPACSIR